MAPETGVVPILGAVTQSDRRSIVHRERTSRMIQGWAHATLIIHYLWSGSARETWCLIQDGEPTHMALAMQSTLPHLFSFPPSSQPAEVMASPVSFLLTQRMRFKCQVLVFKASCHLAPIQCDSSTPTPVRDHHLYTCSVTRHC